VGMGGRQPPPGTQVHPRGQDAATGALGGNGEAGVCLLHKYISEGTMPLQNWKRYQSPVKAEPWLVPF
jgi:hypothetical protein